jgi:hypothetical protein
VGLHVGAGIRTEGVAKSRRPRAADVARQRIGSLIASCNESMWSIIET